MESRWKAWTPATTREKALRVAAPLVEKLGGDDSSLTIEPYPKTNGHVMSFTVRFEDGPWAEVILAVLRRAQSVGYGWGISGRVDEELAMLTNNISLVGISMVTCRIARGGN